MDRASDFGSEGWRFESVRAHHKLEASLAITHQQLINHLLLKDTDLKILQF